MALLRTLYKNNVFYFGFEIVYEFVFKLHRKTTERMASNENRTKSIYVACNNFIL